MGPHVRVDLIPQGGNLPRQNLDQIRQAVDHLGHHQQEDRENNQHRQQQHQRNRKPLGQLFMLSPEPAQQQVLQLVAQRRRHIGQHPAVYKGHQDGGQPAQRFVDAAHIAGRQIKCNADQRNRQRGYADFQIFFILLVSQTDLTSACVSSLLKILSPPPPGFLPFPAIIFPFSPCSRIKIMVTWVQQQEGGFLMQHANPLLRGQDTTHRFITMGEIMLRLTPPNYDKIRVANSFEASYGGSEANIALALANLGVDSTFFTVVPDNSLGKSAIRALRSNDVHCTPVILSSPAETPSHRLGTYYLETGYGIRPSKVIYDRKHSAITEYDFSKVDLRALLKDFTWLHLSGITPALAPNCADLILNALQAAKELGLTVSFDGNFRATLWTWDQARDFCTKCLPYVDVLMGIEPYHLYRDPEHPEKGDWKDGVPLQPSYEQQDEIFQAFVERYPNLKCIARHVRYTHSGSENSLKAFMWFEGHTFESKLFTFTILDRVGGGDAFASGLIYAMMHEEKPMDMLNFAVASSVIKHTIHGDANIVDDAQIIRNLMNMNYDIRR